MDRVSRLIVLIGLLLPLSGFSATYYVGGNFTFISAVEACKAAFAYNGSYVYGSTSGLDCYDNGGVKRFTITQSNCTGVLVNTTGTRYSCVTSCPTGQVNVSGVCQVKPTCASNQQYNSSTNKCDCLSIASAGSFMVPGDEYQGCNNGCMLNLDAGWYDKTANVTWGHKWRQPGTACTVGVPNVLTPTDPKVEAAKQCEAGSCPGTVNGQSVCVPCDKTKQTETGTKSETSATTASGASAPGPSSTSTESTSSRTECSNGSCTTTETTTVTGPGGDKTDKTTSTTEPQSDYCTRNPKADVCKGTESSWGGTCGAFSCDGDAVQCAQAKAGWELACGLKVDETDPLIGVGQQATQGGDRPSDHPGNQANTIALDLSSRLSSVPLFGTSGDCIADKTITFMGKGYTLPFSKWCPYLNILGSAFLAACYLAAAFIIFRD